MGEIYSPDQGFFFLLLLLFYFIFFGLFAFSRAASAACGGSQARGLIRAVATGLHQSHSNADLSRICNLHHSSRQRWMLNPLSEPGIQPATLWFLVGFVSTVPWCELQKIVNSFKVFNLLRVISKAIFPKLYNASLLPYTQYFFSYLPTTILPPSTSNNLFFVGLLLFLLFLKVLFFRFHM